MMILARIAEWWAIRGFQRQRAVWYEDMARSQNDGVAIVDYLRRSIEREQQHGSPKRARILGTILARLPSRPLSEAVAGLIPANEQMLLSAAERSGALPTHLNRMADRVRRISRMRTTVRAALAGPVMPLLILAGTLWYTATSLVPVIAEVIPIEKWTGPPAALRTLSFLTTQFGVPIAVGFLLVLGIAVHQLPRWTGSTRRVADQSVFVWYRDFNGALFLTAFAALLQAGVGQKEALALISRQATPWLRWHCQTISNRLVRYADAPGRAFDVGLLPHSVVLRLMDLVERGTALPEVMERIAETILDETEAAFLATVSRLGIAVDLISTMLMISIAMGISFIAGGVLQ